MIEIDRKLDERMEDNIELKRRSLKVLYLLLESDTISQINKKRETGFQ